MIARPALSALIGFCLAFAPCAASVLASEAPGVAPASADDEAVYRARFSAYQAGKDVYDVLEPVPGAAHPQPLPMARMTTIAPKALAAARAYAVASRSTALLIWRDGALQAADYFGVDASTPLVSKSLAKPLTAIAIGRAIQLGYIKSLDQPVSDFITEWKGTPKAAIKVRYLLDMRSGLLAQAPAPSPDDILNRAYLGPHHDDLIVNRYPLTHEPGAHFDYANAVGDLVAVVIERATHQRYARFVSDAVLQPLGAAGGSVWLDRKDGLAHSACCILLPAETWMRLAMLLVDDGRWRGARLLPAGYVEQMKTPTPQNPYYGLGVYVAAAYTPRRGFGGPDAPGPKVLHSAPYLARDLFLFDGNANQVVYMIPSQRLIILRMGDQPPRSPEWDNAFLPNTILSGLIDAAPGVGPQQGG